MNTGMFGQGVKAREDRRAGYLTDNRFQRKWQAVLKTRAGKRKNPVGVDYARGIGQAKAAVLGKSNVKRAEIAQSVDPVSAAMQHAVRNRSVEQGGNRPVRTYSFGEARNVRDTNKRGIM